MKSIFLLLCALLSIVYSRAQVNGDYRSTGTVTLTSAANWQVYNSGAWANATTSPNGNVTSGNTISILSGHTWNGNTTAATIPAGVTLLFQGVVGGTFTANTLTVSGTYIHFSTASVANVFTAIDATSGFTSNSTVVYRGSSAITPSPVFGGRTYYNLVFDTDGTGNPGISGPVPGANWYINGKLTVNSWRIDLYHATNTFGVISGDVLITGTNSFLRLKNTTIDTGKTLTIDAGDSLAVGPTYTLTINGTLVRKTLKPINVGTGGALIVNGTLQHDANGGNMFSANTTYNPGSTLLVTGVTNVANIPVIPDSCYNVVWNCAAQTTFNTFVNTVPAITTVRGNLTIQSTGPSGSIYLGGAGTSRTLNVLGNLVVTGGNLFMIKPTSNTATADQICNVGGNVTISGGRLSLSDSTTAIYTGKGYLNIGGSLMHTGGLFGNNLPSVAGSGVVTFTGNNTDKTISTTGISGTPSVIIDKTATGIITLAANLTLASGVKVTMNSGKLGIAGGIILQVPDTSYLSGNNATRYIVTHTSGATVGALKMTGINAKTFFPVGTAANYLPVTLTPVTASDYKVGVYQGITANGLPNGSAITATQKAKTVDAVWVVNRTSANTDSCRVNLQWVSALEGAQFATYGNAIGIAGYANNWKPFAGAGDNTTDTASRFISSFGALTVGKAGDSISTDSAGTSIRTVQSAATNFTIFPNPATDRNVTLAVADAGTAPYQLELVNNMGQVMYKEALGTIVNKKTIYVSLPQQISFGVYTMVLTSHDRRLQQRLIIR